MEVLAELRVQVSATRYRVPDVVVLERTSAVEQAPTHPALAVFEVLSSENEMSQLLVKLADYANMGVNSIWLADPKTAKIYRYENSGSRECVSVDPPGTDDRMVIDWQAILRLLDAGKR